MKPLNKCELVDGGIRGNELGCGENELGCGVIELGCGVIVENDVGFEDEARVIDDVLVV